MHENLINNRTETTNYSLHLTFHLTQKRDFIKLVKTYDENIIFGHLDKTLKKPGPQTPLCIWISVHSCFGFFPLLTSPDLFFSLQDNDVTKHMVFPNQNAPDPSQMRAWRHFSCSLSLRGLPMLQNI